MSGATAMKMFGEDQLRIRYYHQARRHLYEYSPAAYECATRGEIEHLADVLRYEDFRLHIDPYMRIKTKLLTDFYSLQVQPSAPIPDWLQEQLTELDEMIASVAKKFGLTVRPNE